MPSNSQNGSGSQNGNGSKDKAQARPSIVPKLTSLNVEQSQEWLKKVKMAGVYEFGRCANGLGQNDELLFDPQPETLPTTRGDEPNQQTRENNKMLNGIMLADWAKRMSGTKHASEKFYAVVADSIDKSLWDKIRADSSFSAIESNSDVFKLVKLAVKTQQQGTNNPYLDSLIAEVRYKNFVITHNLPQGARLLNGLRDSFLSLSFAAYKSTYAVEPSFEAYCADTFIPQQEVAISLNSLGPKFEKAKTVLLNQVANGGLFPVSAEKALELIEKFHTNENGSADQAKQASKLQANFTRGI